MTKLDITSRLAPLSVPFALIVALLVLALTAACSTTPPPVREVTVTKEVPVPFHTPCPKPADKPVVPKPVHLEGSMPKLADGSPDYATISRVLGAKVLELFGYADKADGIMTACSK